MLGNTNHKPYWISANCCVKHTIGIPVNGGEETGRNQDGDRQAPPGCGLAPTASCREEDDTQSKMSFSQRC